MTKLLLALSCRPTWNRDGFFSGGFARIVGGLAMIEQQ